MTEALTPEALCTVACPQCGAGYQVPVAKLAAKPRKLKCAQCANVWLATLPAQAAEAPMATPEVPVRDAQPTAEDTPTPPPAEATLEVVAPLEKEERVAPLAPPPLNALRTPAWQAWVFGEQKWLTLAFIMALMGLAGAGASLWQQLPKPPVVEYAETPMIYRAPQTVVAPPGVVLHQLQAKAYQQEGGIELQLTGKVANTGNALVALPRLQAELLDDTGAVADFWPVALVTTTLPAQSEIAFTVSFTNPVAQGWRLLWVN